MISNQILQNTIEGLKGISRIDFCVLDTEGKLKENPMPESCRDRPSRCYEHIFLLTKSKKYYYDAAAIAQTAR